jgi:putative phosphonate catabolism associated alcohol dehydrogenase
MSDTQKTESQSNIILFDGAGKPLRRQVVPIPQPGPEELLVKVRCVTLCGSDLHTFFGRRSAPTPSILGHETVGEVVSIGRGGVNYAGSKKQVQVGDRVTWSIVWSCGRCFFCQRSLHPKCEQLIKFGHIAWNEKNPLLGGLSDYCLLPAGTALVAVPDSVPDLLACLANCAGATVAAIFRRIRESGSGLAESVMVLQGFGMLGMIAAGMARTAGVRRVIVLEPDVARREQALLFGADHAMDPLVPKEQMLTAIGNLTDGRGADFLLELSGSAGALEVVPDLLRKGGACYLAGSVFPGKPLNWSAEQIVRNMLTIQGIHNYNPIDLQTAVDYFTLVDDLRRQLLLDSISPPRPFLDVEEAFSQAASRSWLRVALVPGKSPSL